MSENFVRDEFEILYESPISDDAAESEIILLYCRAIPSYHMDEVREKITTSQLKLRRAPRKFDKYNIVDVSEVRIYYWSNTYGSHLMKPSWKEKDGIYIMDAEETVKGTRQQAMQEGLNYNNPEMEAYLEKLNSIHIGYGFCEQGYWHNNSSFGGDWARSELTVYFLRGEFRIESYEIARFEIMSHWEIEEVWENAKSMITAKRWGMNELAELISGLDTYDTRVALYYYKDAGISSKKLRMDGGKVKWFEDYDWEKEVLKVIENINGSK